MHLVMMTYIAGYTISISLAGALDTLCGQVRLLLNTWRLDLYNSQAYGAGNYDLVGLHFQRMVCFMWIVCVPLAISWWYSAFLMKFIVEPEIAELTAQYLRVVIVTLPCHAAYEAGKRYLQAQGLYYVTMTILLVLSPLNFVLNWFFVWHLGWGFIGAPSAVAVTYTLQPVMLGFYVRYMTDCKCWTGLSWRIFTNWGMSYTNIHWEHQADCQ